MEKKEKKPKAKKDSAKEELKEVKTPAVKAHPKEEVLKKEEPIVAPKKPEETIPEDEAFDESAFEKAEDIPGKPERYWEAVGRRKTSIARVRLFTRGDKSITVNEMPYGNYFFTIEQQKLAEDSLQKMKSMARFRVVVKVNGGGLKAQAEAVRHGIARALVEFNPDFRKRLRRAGFLTRDPRMKERKKFGLKSARKRPQWAKR